jgi:hypothetical protein
MLQRVSVRIAAAFIVVGLATTLAVGAGLVVTLRELHREATRAAMADVAQPLVARVRLAAGTADLRARITALRDELPEGVDAILLRPGGRIVGDASSGADFGSLELDPGLLPGQVAAGSIASADGTPLLYAATIVSRTVAGATAIVLATPDRSAAAAWR